MKEDKLNTYYTELRWVFKDHTANRESIDITIAENGYSINAYSNEFDGVVMIDLTPKSARS